MTPKVLALIWISVSAALALAGLVTIAMAWRGQPSRGRRRCGRCWYDMAAVVGLKCPECGKVANDERGLFRTRRSRRAMGVGVLLLMFAGYVGLATSRMGPNRERWTRWLPTTLLVFIAPVDRSERGHELAQAAWLRSRSMWRWQEAIIARREIVATDDDEIRQWLRVRTVWPVGVSMPLRLGPERDKWPLTGPTQVELQSTDGRGLHLRAATDSWSTISPHDPLREPDWNSDGAPVPYEVEIPAMEPGRHNFEFEMTLSGRWGVRRTVMHKVSIDVTPRDADVMTAVTSRPMDKVIAESLRAWKYDGDGGPGLSINFDDQQIFDALYRASYVSGKLSEPVLAVVIEVMDGDRALVTFRLDHYGSRGIDGPPNLDAIRSIAVDPVTCAWKPEVTERLQVHVRGDLGLAARSVGPASYWAGEFSMPLFELLTRSRP